MAAHTTVVLMIFGREGSVAYRQPHLRLPFDLAQFCGRVDGEAKSEASVPTVDVKTPQLKIGELTRKHPARATG